MRAGMRDIYGDEEYVTALQERRRSGIAGRTHATALQINAG